MTRITKARTVSKDEMKDLVDKFSAKYKYEGGSKVEVDPKVLSNEFKVTTSIVEKVFIEAINQGLCNVALKSKDRSIEKRDKQCINPRGNFVLPKDTITHLNEHLDDERKFKIGDKFKVTLDGEKIILDRVPCEFPQEQDSTDKAA